MKSIPFKGHNKILGKGSDNPAYIYRDRRTYVSCWSFSFRQRLRLLLTGKLYIEATTFNRPPQPLKLSLENKIR